MKLIARKNLGRDPFWNYWDRSFLSDFPVEKQENRIKNIRTPMNIIENDNVYTIELLVPGWKKSEINIEVNDDTLKVFGDKESSEDTKAKEDRIRLKEFKSEKFYRSVILGDTVDREGIEAKLEDGVLRLVLPKVPEEQPETPQKIEIK